MLHLPILRAGKPYRSLEVKKVPHFQTGETVVEVSQANRGLIAKDIALAGQNKQALAELSVEELIEICKKAADLFMNSDLPIGEDLQSPMDYVHQLSSTTGMPESLCHGNMSKISLVLREMEAVLGGLTRGLDLSVLDSGWRSKNGQTLSYTCEADALGAVLPSNSPGVHSLWLPAIPLKVPLVLKPGSQEPWTPYRIAQALIGAGCPPEAASYYPTDYSGATEILLRCGRSMLFGDKSTVSAWEKDRRVQIHGPGWSKVIIGEDKISQWESYLDVIETSVVANGGRSCINASGVWVPSHGREIAEALAQRLAKISARAMDDPEAQIAAFSNRTFAQKLSYMIDSHLKTGGAVDMTAEYRNTDRFVEAHGATFLLPTVIWCDEAVHPLANTEFLFPFVSVVEAPQEELPDRIGSTLVVTAITEDRKFIRELFASPNVDRLNLGPIPTTQISWDQPHEGNLFEHLYRQRALQMAGEYDVA